LNGLKQLTAGMPLTDALIGMRDLTVTTTPLVSTLLGLKLLTAGTTLTDAVIAQGTRLTAAETLAAPLTSLTTTLIAVRDFTPGTFLYTNVSGYNTRLIAVETLNSVGSTALYTAVTGQGTRLTALENMSGTPNSTLYTTVTGYGTRLAAAENLNGVATTLTNTVKQVRDLNSGTPLFTVVDNMRTLAAGTSLTNTVNALAAPPILRYMTDPWIAANDGGWRGTWSQYSDSNTYPVHMTLKNGLVKMQGIAGGGSTGSVVMRLPIGYRPANPRTITIDAQMQHGEVYLNHLTGDISYRNGPATPSWISFDNIIFLAAP
jgi:hypothetical protein